MTRPHTTHNARPCQIYQPITSTNTHTHTHGRPQAYTRPARPRSSHRSVGAPSGAAQSTEHTVNHRERAVGEPDTSFGRTDTRKIIIVITARMCVCGNCCENVFVRTDAARRRTKFVRTYLAINLTWFRMGVGAPLARLRAHAHVEHGAVAADDTQSERARQQRNADEAGRPRRTGAAVIVWRAGVGVSLSLALCGAPQPAQFDRLAVMCAGHALTRKLRTEDVGRHKE